MSEPRIIVYDLETMPIMSEAMKVFIQLSNYPGQTIKASINSIICVGWKEYASPKTNCLNAWDFPKWRKNVNDDKDICLAAYEILKGADAVVTHNGKRFDQKFLNTRLMINGLPPLPKIPHIDTCSELKRHLMLFNNKLDTAARFLTNERKMENGGWDLWVRVMNREPEAMKKMTKYCKQDVITTEALFRKLKPLINSIPNYNHFSRGIQNICPNCGSTRMQRRGYRYTATKAYARYSCFDCGSSFRTDGADKNPRTY